MITVAVEPWGRLRPEIERLSIDHWAEVADAMDRERVPLDIAWPEYDALDASGSLHAIGVRDEGRLVGYHLSVVKPHLHYSSTLCAFVDVYFLAPAYRRGGIGLRLFTEAENTLKARGVKKVFSGTKAWLDVSPLFQRLGWTEAERLFTKYLGD